MALFFALCISGCTDDSTSVDPHALPLSPAIEEPATQAEPPTRPQDEAADATSITETITPPVQSTTTPETHEIPAARQEQIKLETKTPPAPLQLGLPEQRSETLNNQVDILGTNPLTRTPTKKKATDKTLKISGGVLLNSEAEELSERLDGAEVKFDLKWK
ncbi:MAG: hypothetical protein RBR43_08750 [Desulfuromonadaceae bacterium]|nr:hypothetical protein [Desulfuromonas sp.]MDY0185951.1 hypothetical protein [Desulfuromonadaceae bacterium]